MIPVLSFVFEKSRVFLFHSIVSFKRFFEMSQFSFAFVERKQLFLMISFEFLRGKLARGRPKLISTRMPYF